MDEECWLPLFEPALFSQGSADSFVVSIHVAIGNLFLAVDTAA
jgi:hypothetical protein